jgi:hypothetical protein
VGISKEQGNLKGSVCSANGADAMLQKSDTVQELGTAQLMVPPDSTLAACGMLCC